jgi:hypothetical protein
MKSGWTFGTLKKYFERVLAERDKAVAAALAAAESAVRAAFDASEKAIIKAEAAQLAYNTRSNEFRASLDDQNKTMLPRSEADTKFQQLRELIDAQANLITELQRSESGVAGGTRYAQESKSIWLAVWAIIATVVLAVLGGLGTLIFFLATKG